MPCPHVNNPTVDSTDAEMGQQLIRALQDETPVTILFPSGSGHRRANGIIVALLQDGCKLQLHEPCVDCPTASHSEDVVLQLAFADGTYSLRTQLTTVAGDSVCYAAWPTPTKRVERRRSKRRDFASGTTVDLLLERDRAQRRASGVLLNLSPDGLACLIPTDDHDGMHLGGTLHARFRPRPHDDVMVIESRIASILRAGTQGHRIIGVEFVANEAYAALRRALMAALEYQDEHLKATT